MPAVVPGSPLVDPPERAAPVSPAQGGDLQVARRQGPVRARQCRGGPLNGRVHAPVGPPDPRHALGDGLGVAAENGEAVLVGDRPLVGDVVQLVLGVAELGHEDLDLERLHFVREHVAEILGIEIGERPGVDVVAAVRVALGVGMTDARHTELVVLVVLPHAAEGDPVVNLADLVQ